MQSGTMNLGKSVLTNTPTSSSTTSSLATKAPGILSRVGGLVSKIARVGGPLGIAASAVTPSDTPQEKGRFVDFGKNEKGQTYVKGYSDTPKADASKPSAMDTSVGNMARRGGLAPSVKSGGNTPVAPIKPATTNSPLSLTGDKSQVRPWVPQSSSAKQTTPDAKNTTTKTGPVKQSFSQAYQSARKEAQAAGKDPNIAQFKWTGKSGKEGTYQAAATKKDYVSMGKQFKTGVGSSTTGSTATNTSKPPEPAKTTSAVPTPPSRPAGIGTPASYKPSSPATDRSYSPDPMPTVKTPSVVTKTQNNATWRANIGDTKSINFDVMRTGDGAKIEKDRLNDAGRDYTSAQSVVSKSNADVEHGTTPSGGTTAAGGNPTPSGGGIAPDAGRQSTPTDSGSSIRVKPEPSSTKPAPTPKTPDEKKGVAVESKLNECVQVGNYKYRIV